MIPQSFLDDLLQRVDIVEVVSRYVPLKKAGQNYQACCPFHNEKSPSFTVSPTKQFYHCFGCGAHGTAISFLMEHGGMGFVDAVETLASSVGLTVPNDRATPGEEPRRPLTDALELMIQATRFYREALKNHPPAIDYLKRRGLSGSIAARFGLGYAPEGWQALEAIVPDYQTSKPLAETGLIIENEQGRRYDRFRDRIMFPIINLKGQIIGFGGRVLDQGQPKYLNSPETPLFEKGRELYGLYQARDSIRDKDYVLVVEGYMDVVALAQFGIHNAVATLGTATTAEHLKKLLRHTQRIVFCFDGDKAGRKAAWRALEHALPVATDQTRFEFIFLPPEDDPDSFVRAHGAAGFEAFLEQEKQPLSAFLIHTLMQDLDAHSAEGRAQLVAAARPYLETLQQAPALHLLLQQRLAELTGLSDQQIARLTGQNPAAAQAFPPATSPPPRAARPVPSLWRKLLVLLLLDPTLAHQVPEELRARLEKRGEEGEFRRALEIVTADPNLDRDTFEQELVGPMHPRLRSRLEQERHLPLDETQLASEFDLGQIRRLLDNRELERLTQRQNSGQGLGPEEKQRLLQLLQRKPG